MASRILRDYKCQEHGFFEGFKPVCPEGCEGEFILAVFLKSPGLVSAKTKATDKTARGLAKDFGMSDIQTTREGEHQTGFLTKKNKFSEKEYADAAKYATPKAPAKRRKGRSAAPIEVPQQRESRPGDSAIWGGGGDKGAFGGVNMQSVIAGRYGKSVAGESVGLTPTAAGINNGPTIDPRSTLRDPENLTIKKT